MTVFRNTLIASMLLLTSAFSIADEHIDSADAPDPGDHTKVSTVGSITYGKQSFDKDNNDFVQLIGQMSGAKDNGHLFLGLLSLQGQDNGKVGSDEFNLSQVRARYFEVAKTQSQSAPMVGLSLDYIETSFTDALSDRLFAVGALVRLETPFSNWMLFPIAAFAAGQNNRDFAKIGVVNDYTFGAQLNFLNSIYLHKNGTHVQLNPQFSSLDFGGDVGTVNQLQLDAVLQMPISHNRKHWGKVTYTEYFDDVEQSFGHNRQGTELKLTYNYFF